MTIANRVGAGFAAVMLACGILMPAKADVMKELAPTGKLRVAIAVAPAPCPHSTQSRTDNTTGQYRGVTVQLGSALAKKLGVPVEFLPHLASGEIQNSAASGKWDVTFMPVDEERKKFVDFGNAYHLLQSTYLVAPSSKLAKVEDRETRREYASAVSLIPRLSVPPSVPHRRRLSSQCPASMPRSPP